MADYPATIYTPRVVENAPLVVYTPSKTTVGYAEDVNLSNDEIVAIETELGLNPSGAFSTVAERLDSLGTGDITGTGATGYVAFFTGAKAISGDDEFYWDNTNKRLGIGTNAPAYKLHVVDEQTDPASTVIGTNITPLITLTDNNANPVYGFRGGFDPKVASGKYASQAWIGFHALAYRNRALDAGRMAELRGFWSEAGHGANIASSALTDQVMGHKINLFNHVGTITQVWGLQINAVTETGTTYTSYGLEITPMLGQSATYGLLMHRGLNVLNEDGGDWDTRVEGDTDPNLFFVDAGNDRVGVGTNAPGEKFSVAGNVQVTGDDDILIAGNQVADDTQANVTRTLGPAIASYFINASGGAPVTHSIWYQLFVNNSRQGRVVTIRGVTFYYALSGTTKNISVNRLFKIGTDGTETNIDNDTTPLTSGTSHACSSLPYTLAAGEALMLELKPSCPAVGVPTSGTVAIRSINLTLDTA